MKTTRSQSTLRRVSAVGALALALASTGVVNATLISQSFTQGYEGGIVTFDDNLGGNQLRITFDNTSSMWNGVITGVVFNVTADINAATMMSFVDGDGNPITGWTVGLNIDNELTPGNTKFDIAFETTNGINSGIYNKGVATNVNNVVPDIATLILLVTDPGQWALSSIGSDSLLRMQRTGAKGKGSLKIVTSTSSSSTSTSSTGGQTTSGSQVSEPGMLGLLGIGLLGQAVLLRQRRRRLQK